MKIELAPGVSIDESEIEERFIRASGPGGQNVNKVASAVQLRFDIANAAGLPEAVKARLKRLPGAYASKDGVIVITARRHRDQARNRADARERLYELIRQAAVAPKPRTRTKIPAAARKKRLETKARRGVVKKLRARPGDD
ncbi:MAG: alternative ribosome rescue aminoacyl-tRNA hydrolase ArfB [Maricaulaceae bacterium]|jgi:ribosome-associated protein